jgi:hypothetical protein
VKNIRYEKNMKMNNVASSMQPTPTGIIPDVYNLGDLAVDEMCTILVAEANICHVPTLQGLNGRLSANYKMSDIRWTALIMRASFVSPSYITVKEFYPL